MDVLRGLQEGWMEMPELFGNPYVLPAVIVVVLLLVLLLIVMMRKRRGTSQSEVRSMERVAAPPAGPAAAASIMPMAAADSQPGPLPSQAPSQATGAPDTSLVPQPQSPAAAAQPVVAKERPAPVTPVAKATKFPERAALNDDPLRAVILDIVHGWGDLTSEDTNRLNLFRADKVLAAAEAIDLPKEDAGGGYARTRLLQIRKYAADKQLQQKPPEAAPEVQPSGVEPVLTMEAVETDPEETATLVAEVEQTPSQETRAEELAAGEPQPEGPPPSWELPQPTEHLAGAGLATAAFAATPHDEKIEDRLSLEKELGEDEGEWTQSAEPIVIPPWPEESRPEESVATSPWPEDSQPVETTASSPWPEESQPLTPATASPWSEEPTGWDIDEPPVLEEVPVELDDEQPLPAAAVADIGPAAATAATAITEETTPVQDITDQFQAPDDSLSTLHGRVRTAEELMALPAGDQADMLAFLEPPELARVFEASEDRRLKKGVIDVLENLGSPGSLDVLRRCLDDADPEMQVYALDAADRLLGVE